MTIRDLQKDKAALTLERDNALQDLGSCRNNKIQLEGAIKAANDATEYAKFVAEQAAAKGAAALKAAEGQIVKLRKGAAAVDAFKNTDDICADADAIILESLK